MRQRPLGKTGLSVSELGLGTWGLSGEAYGPVTEAERDKVIDRALALGLTLFETADSYGQGEIERVLGQRLPKGGSVQVVTKVGTDRSATPPRKRFDAEYLRGAVERSRERLDRETLDVVLLHNPAATTIARGEATGALAELVSSGAVRAWGVSAGNVEVARAALEQGAGVISLAYNAFLSSDLHEIHEDIERAGAGVLAHSILLYGLLCGYWSMHKEFADGDHRAERWTADELRRRVHQVGALRALIGDQVYTLRAGALRYVLCNEDVSSALVGPKNTVQLDQLVREAGKGPPYLDDDKLRKFATRLEDLGVNP